MVYAKKSLGQHFLKSERALDAIVGAADPKADDLILEVGPGRGALTERLGPFAGKIIAIEKDDLLYEELKEKYSRQITEGKLDLINGDALEFDPDTLSFYRDLTYKFVANIPYNITGAIIRKFLSADYEPERMVILVQKEVAERIARAKKESIISIAVKAYGRPRYVETVKAGSFAPAPEVDSAVLAIEDISKSFFTSFSEEAFFGMVHTGFSSKRKKLSTNLTMLFDREAIGEAFRALSLDDNVRAEDVSVEIWQKLAERLLG